MQHESTVDYYDCNGSGYQSAAVSGVSHWDQLLNSKGISTSASGMTVDGYCIDGYQYQCLKQYECIPLLMDRYQYLKLYECRPLCMDRYHYIPVPEAV